MPPKTLTRIGAAILVAAVVLFWGTGHWLRTRNFEPVNMPISLEAGRVQTGNFRINLREDYRLYIDLDARRADTCNSESLSQISWSVVRLPAWYERSSELWATSEHEWRSGGYLGGFRAVPGTYQLELQNPGTPGCLSARHPRLLVDTPPNDYQQSCSLVRYFSLFCAAVGPMLVLRAIWGWKLLRLQGTTVTRILPEMALRNVIPLKRHRPMAAIDNLEIFGPTWFGVIAALSVVFLLYLTKPMTVYGLPINFRKPYVAGGSASPWRESLSVYVDAHRGFQLNGKLVKKEKLGEELREELGKRMVWTVYVEADRDSVFEDTVFAMDAIQGLGAKVIWITPRVREEWSVEVADRGVNRQK